MIRIVLDGSPTASSDRPLSSWKTVEDVGRGITPDLQQGILLRQTTLSDNANRQGPPFGEIDPCGTRVHGPRRSLVGQRLVPRRTSTLPMAPPATTTIISSSRSSNMTRAQATNGNFTSLAFASFRQCQAPEVRLSTFSRLYELCQTALASQVSVVI